MAPLPSRKALESMKRTDLQKLCKDYGVKANLKSEALINLLIDTAKPTVSSPTRRSRQSSRGGPSRTRSIVMHGSDEEVEEKESRNKVIHDQTQSDASVSFTNQLTPPPATRTRKGKEQTRLGIGRPVAAGGAGPRAVTRSLSITKPKAKPGRGSRSLKQTEATVVEEESQQSAHNIDLAHERFVVSGEPPTQETIQPFQEKPSDTSLESLATIDKHVADALRPLHEQIKSMKSELELMQALKVEVGKLKTQINEMANLKERVESLTAMVRDLREETDEVSSSNLEANVGSTVPENTTPTTPNTGSPSNRPRAGGASRPNSLVSWDIVNPRESHVATASSTAIHLQPHLDTAPSILGKRHRDSTASEIVTEPKHAERSNAAQDEIRPSRKRAKISTELVGLDSSQAAGDLLEADRSHHGTDFRVFNGSEVSHMHLVDPPPPIESLPDFFPPPSPLSSEPPIIPRQGHLATSTASATENQQPFTFSFRNPISSTPAHGIFMPSFPYPEPPQSPSPAGGNVSGFLTQPGRSDVFQTFGFPPPRRRTAGHRGTSGAAGGFINPAALTYPNDESDEQATLTPGDGASTSTSLLEAAPMKRTMYGTELDGDTRFGDFGVEGVGNSKGGFWAGGRF